MTVIYFTDFKKKFPNRKEEKKKQIRINTTADYDEV